MYDNAGNSTVCPSNQTVRIDKTAPTCTSSGGNNNWTNDSRTLTGTCNDTRSGCQGNASWYINWEGNWTDLSPGTVYDNAGNSTVCPSNQIVRIDKTAPSCSVTTSGGTKGANGWYKEGTSADNKVKITGKCNDTGSGCRGNVSTTRYKDTKGEDVSPGIVKDNAGNTRTCNTVNIKIDTKKPTCTSSGGINDWSSKSITLTGTCSDSGSGCQGNVTKIYTNFTNLTQQSPGTVYDKAGNATICPANQTVKVDIPKIIKTHTNLITEATNVKGYKKINLSINDDVHDNYELSLEIKTAPGGQSLAYSYSSSGGGKSISADIPSNTEMLYITANHRHKDSDYCQKKHEVIIKLYNR